MTASEEPIRAGSGERMRAFVREHTPGTARSVDKYLSLHLPDFIERYNLGQRDEIAGVINDLNDREVRVGNLEKWRDATKERISGGHDRIGRLEKKYGIGKR